MTDAELRAIAEEATPGPWWQTAMPWNDIGTSVHAGDYDPHLGETVCDTDTSCTYSESRDVANAAHIAAWSPARALAALDFLDALRPFFERPFSGRGALGANGVMARGMDTEMFQKACAALARWKALETHR